MKSAWFNDGAYIMKAWNPLNTQCKLDYIKLKKMLETTYLSESDGEKIEDA